MTQAARHAVHLASAGRTGGNSPRPTAPCREFGQAKSACPRVRHTAAGVIGQLYAGLVVAVGMRRLPSRAAHGGWGRLGLLSDVVGPATSLERQRRHNRDSRIFAPVEIREQFASPLGFREKSEPL